MKYNTSRAPGARSTVCKPYDVTTDTANERSGASDGRSPAGGAGWAPPVSALKRRSSHPGRGRGLKATPFREACQGIPERDRDPHG